MQLWVLDGVSLLRQITALSFRASHKGADEMSEPACAVPKPYAAIATLTQLRELHWINHEAGLDDDSPGTGAPATISQADAIHARSQLQPAVYTCSGYL